MVRDEEGGDAFDWVVINEGQTKEVTPKDFSTYNEKTFEQQFVKSFLNFVGVAEGELKQYLANAQLMLTELS